MNLVCSLLALSTYELRQSEADILKRVHACAMASIHLQQPPAKRKRFRAGINGQIFAVYFTTGFHK